MEVCWPVFQIASSCTQKEAPEGTRGNQPSFKRLSFINRIVEVLGWQQGTGSTFLLCCRKGSISIGKCRNGRGWAELCLVSPCYTRSERTKHPRLKWEMTKGPLWMAFCMQSLELFLKRRNTSWALGGVTISSRKLHTITEWVGLGETLKTI